MRVKIYYKIFGLLIILNLMNSCFSPPGYLDTYIKEEGNSIAIYNSETIYIAGSYSGTGDFDPSGQNFKLSSNGISDMFLTSFETVAKCNKTPCNYSLK
jgi:hypothetical protein